MWKRGEEKLFPAALLSSELLPVTTLAAKQKYPFYLTEHFAISQDRVADSRS